MWKYQVPTAACYAPGRDPPLQSKLRDTQKYLPIVNPSHFDHKSSLIISPTQSENGGKLSPVRHTIFSGRIWNYRPRVTLKATFSLKQFMRSLLPSNFIFECNHVNVISTLWMGLTLLLFCVALQEINLSGFTYFQIRDQLTWKNRRADVTLKQKSSVGESCVVTSFLIRMQPLLWGFLLLATFCNFQSVFLV